MLPKFGSSVKQIQSTHVEMLVQCMRNWSNLNYTNCTIAPVAISLSSSPKCLEYFVNLYGSDSELKACKSIDRFSNSFFNMKLENWSTLNHACSSSILSHLLPTQSIFISSLFPSLLHCSLRCCLFRFSHLRFPRCLSLPILFVLSSPFEFERACSWTRPLLALLVIQHP